MTTILSQKHWVFYSLILSSILMCVSCNKREPQEPQTYSDLIYSAMTFAVEAGGLYGEVASQKFNAQKIIEYTTVDEMLEALLNKEVDTILLSVDFTAQLQKQDIFPEFDYILIPEEIYVNKAAPIFHTEALRDKYNEWFATAVEDGTWAEVINRWITGKLPAPDEIPQFDFTDHKGVIRVVDTGNYPPLSYLMGDDERLVGFDADMANRFILSLGMRPEYIIVPYEEAAQYVLDGKADMSACTYAISDTREGKMIFGEPSLITQIVMIVLKDRKTR